MTSSTTYGSGDTSYQAAGQLSGLTQLVNDFYDMMDSLPEATHIRAMHPQDLTVSRDKLTLFLSSWLNGPRLYSEKYGKGITMPQAHAHLPIDDRDRSAWMECMNLALQKQDYAEDFKAYLLTQLNVPASRIVTLCKRHHNK
ncbi:MAG: group II truncated hemoglobin [Gammaproteobacteria bacterium]|nr:group II truncated hemoglobin [Gammaproteobacteria bacterium]